jgi:hypothetical protein
VDECVEDTAELLDACAGIRDRLDMLRSYVTATRIALHWLEGHGGGEAFRPRRAVSGVAHCAAGGGKPVAQWECELQEVQRRVRKEYDRRRKDGVACMAELDAAAAGGRAVRCAVAGGRRCPETLAADARRRCDDLEETVLRAAVPCSFTAISVKRLSAFLTALSSQQLFHILQPNQTHPKCGKL